MRFHWKTVTAWLLGILGLSSCGGRVGIISQPCMYGVPMSVYDVDITVTDEDGKPLKGIEASCGETKVISDQDGKIRFVTSDYNNFFVNITDIDGEENGGEYLPVNLDGNSFEKVRTERGKGKWDEGTFSMKAVVQLKKGSR